MNDKIYKYCLITAVGLILPVGVGIFLTLLWDAMPAFEKFGVIEFITSCDGNSVAEGEKYGALPYIVGTLATSFLALIISVPFSLAAALFSGEYYRGKRFAGIIDSAVAMLAGIPSIIYGLWGFAVLNPILVSMKLSETGYGILSASLLLAIMIIPYSASLTKEFIMMVPSELKEGAYSLGATRSEVIAKIVLPKCMPGIISTFILALGRALGETMAVTMVIGNTNFLPKSITDTGNTMASIIANRFGEADGLQMASLIAIALLLFVITFIVNLTGKFIVKKLKA